MFDQIIELQNTQDAIYRAALEELQRRLQFEEKKKQHEIEVWLFYQWVYSFNINEFIATTITNTTNNFPAEMLLETVFTPAFRVLRRPCSRQSGHPHCHPVVSIRTACTRILIAYGRCCLFGVVLALYTWSPLAGGHTWTCGNQSCALAATSSDLSKGLLCPL